MNKEAYVGKTACYEVCKLGHNCLSGRNNYEPVCEEEMDRERAALRKAFPGEAISLQAENGKGLYFTRGENYECVVQNEAGVWVKRDNPVYF